MTNILNVFYCCWFVCFPCGWVGLVTSTYWRCSKVCLPPDSATSGCIRVAKWETVRAPDYLQKTMIAYSLCLFGATPATLFQEESVDRASPKEEWPKLCHLVSGLGAGFWTFIMQLSWEISGWEVHLFMREWRIKGSLYKPIIAHQAGQYMQFPNEEVSHYTTSRRRKTSWTATLRQWFPGKWTESKWKKCLNSELLKMGNETESFGLK